MKLCNICKRTLSLDNFTKCASCVDGLRNICRQCDKEYKKIYREKNREKILAYYRRQYLLNSETRKENSRKHYWDNRDKKLAYNKACYDLDKEREKKLRRTYGISFNDKKKLLDSQGGKCAICTVILSADMRQAHVDHSHSLNKVRGILCRNCNVLLGYCFENIEILENAIKYLKVHLDKDEIK